MAYKAAEYANDPFWQGFIFARQVHEIFGMKLSNQQIQKLFQEVVSGEATIMGTSAEFFRTNEKMSETIKQKIEPLVSRDNIENLLREHNEQDRRYAQQYLDVLDELNPKKPE